MDLQIIPYLGPLRHHGCFHAGKVDQRGDLEPWALRQFRFSHLPKVEISEERKLDGTAAVHGHREIIRRRFADCGTFQVGHGSQQELWLESQRRKEVEINRLAMSQTQCDCRAAVKNKII